jgi:predicted short-subunit dehydrogenase-like oxidoreductase (DUF2520 family)
MAGDVERNGAVAIVGAGRMGQGLGDALTRAGRAVTLLVRPERAHALVVDVPARSDAWAETLGAADVVLVATPDDALTAVASRLAELRAIGPDHVVLHLSGVLDRSALAPLVRSRAALGSFHPLQTVADPRSAAERLRGAFAGVEGDARATAAAEGLARELGMTAVRLDGEAKALYHAAATIAANYSVALAGLADRLAARAGVEPSRAEAMFVPLMRGAVENVAALGAAGALTGPIRRADLRTLAAHLGVLEADEQHLYRLLGLEALRLAREGGLEEHRARHVEAVLSEET